MDFNINNIAGLALIGSALAFYKQIQSTVYKICSILIRTDEIQFMHSNFINKIIEDSKIVRWGNVCWAPLTHTWVKKYNFETSVMGRLERTIFLFYKGRIPCLIKKTRSAVKITYLYKTIDVEKIAKETYLTLINETLSDEKERLEGGGSRFFAMHEVSGLDEHDFKKISGETAFLSGNTPNNESQNDNDLIPLLPGDLKYNGKYLDVTYDDINQQHIPIKTNYYWSKEALKLKRELEFFINNNKWFKDRNIQKKRGVLISSVPGCGKTKMVLECAKECKIPIRKLNISNMSDQEFNNEYHKNGYDQCIILIEDLDSVFVGRENLLAKNSRVKNLLSFDTLINRISGIKEQDGIFLIVTVNDISKLDPALIRPGRLDVKIEVGNLDKEGRYFIANNILKGYTEEIEKIVNENEEVTIAEFENKCIQRGIQLIYSTLDK